MLIKDKAILQEILQKWLEDNADDIGGNYGIWQDTTSLERNSELLVKACEIVIDSMALQSTLHQEISNT